MPKIKKIFCAHVSFLFRYQCSGCNKVWKTKKSLKGHIYLKHKELLRGDVDSWVNMIARRKHADHRRENSIEITGLSACLIVSFFFCRCLICEDLVDAERTVIAKHVNLHKLSMSQYLRETGKEAILANFFLIYERQLLFLQGAADVPTIRDGRWGDEAKSEEEEDDDGDYEGTGGRKRKRTKKRMAQQVWRRYLFKKPPRQYHPDSPPKPTK